MTDIAIVTGASAGLGIEFARKLAKDGHNLLLIARRAERLTALAQRLHEKFGVEVFTFACDLSQVDAADKVMAHCKARGLRVTTLINNAGFGLRGEFANMDGARQAEMIQLNCVALTTLCHAVLPDMIARRSGGILNIASTASFQAGPLMAVYYATKAYVLSFSEALHEEVRKDGVRVACLCPGPTQTEFSDLADLTNTDLFKLFAGKPDAVVRDGLAALRGNRAVKISGLFNTLLAQSIRTVPRKVARLLAMRLQKGRGV